MKINNTAWNKVAVKKRETEKKRSRKVTAKEFYLQNEFLFDFLKKFPYFFHFRLFYSTASSRSSSSSDPGSSLIISTTFILMLHTYSSLF